MKNLFIIIHLSSVALALVLVGFYAPEVWVCATYALFIGSLVACEACKSAIKHKIM